MDDRLTVVIPFWRGNDTLQSLLDSIPSDVPIVIAKDAESPSPVFARDGVTVVSLGKRGYFAGACNLGINATRGDVLILNQDAVLSKGWLGVIESNRAEYAVIGEGVFDHPSWPAGYAQGTFMFMRRDAIKAVGGFNAAMYPLWGATCEWQLRACRAGFKTLPLEHVRGFTHADGRHERYGSAIAQALAEEPHNKDLFTRIPPEISVIVPCYNYGRYLPDALNSLALQSFVSFEVIIADDASTDGSAEIAQELVDPFRGIRLVRNHTNVGIAANINSGIAQARGKYITILSADDTYKPERLDVLYKMAQAHPDRVLYDDMVWSINGRETVRPMREYNFSELLNSNIMHAGIFYPREAWVKAGGYPEIMRDGREDWAFNIALGAAGYCGLRVPQAMYVYRRDGQNRSLHNQMDRFEQRLPLLFPKIYNGEVTVCNCKGGARQRSSGSNLLATEKPYPDAVLVEYIGKNTGNEAWKIPGSRRKMMFSHNVQRWVSRTEAEYLLSSGVFKVVIGAAVEPHKLGEVENGKADVA